MYTQKIFYFVLFQVSEDDIDEMFNFADKDKDGKISFLEFQIMINPPKLQTDFNKNRTKDSVKKVTIVEGQAHDFDENAEDLRN